VVQEKDAQIAALEARLAALEEAVGVKGAPVRPGRAGANPVPTTGLPAGWLLFGGLSLVGLVVGQRWRARSRR